MGPIIRGEVEVHGLVCDRRVLKADPLGSIYRVYSRPHEAEAGAFVRTSHRPLILRARASVMAFRLGARFGIVVRRPLPASTEPADPAASRKAPRPPRRFVVLVYDSEADAGDAVPPG